MGEVTLQIMSDYTEGMRRWISVVLLCLLPVQVWAQAGVLWCPHALASAAHSADSVSAQHGAHFAAHPEMQIDLSLADEPLGVADGGDEAASGHHDHCGAGCHSPGSMPSAESRWTAAALPAVSVIPWANPFRLPPALAGPYRPPTVPRA